MDTNFDLDVNNYDISDLIKFFNLPNNYNIELLEKNVNSIIQKIFNVDNSNFNSKHKFDVINFIKLAKDILISFYYDIQTQNEIKKINDKGIDMKLSEIQLGNIINPLGVHPALQYTAIYPNNITGYNHNENISVYIFNTITRENYFTTSSTNCIFSLPTKLKNVLSLSLTSLQLPNVFFAFSAERGTNQLFIQEDNTNLSGTIQLPDGNYTNSSNDTIGNPTNSIGNAMEKAINEQILGIFNPTDYRFFVNVDPVTNFTIISNTTNTFSMKIITDNLPNEENTFCSPYVFPNVNVDDNAFNTNNNFNHKSNLKNNNYTNNYTNNLKINLKPSEYTSTLGYLLGYREISYSGSLSYTSESPFNGVYSSYLYFALNDYTGSQQISNTYGVLQNSLIDDNVLGVIPLDGKNYSYIFENNSNLIYKRRNYFGPVDISKISIKLLNPFGQVVNLLQNDFSFSLNVTSNYNLKESKIPNVTPIV